MCRTNSVINIILLITTTTTVQSYNATTFDEIKCGESSNCIIDCTSEFCEGQTINATNKSTLHVLCNENNINSTCNYLTIYCPQTGNCDIKCNMSSHSLSVVHSRCRYMKIRSLDSAQKSNITIECTAYASCFGIYVYASNVNSLTLNANATLALSGATISARHVNEFNLIKKNDLFYHGNNPYWFNLYLPSHENSSINIDCYGLACTVMEFNVDNIENVAKGINIISYCECPNGQFLDCIYLWVIVCELSKIDGLWNDTCESNECGCQEMLNILANNYVDNDDEYCYEDTTTMSTTEDVDDVATTTEGSGVGFSQSGREKYEKWMIISIIFIILFAIAATIICVLLWNKMF